MMMSCKSPLIPSSLVAIPFKAVTTLLPADEEEEEDDVELDVLPLDEPPTALRIPLSASMSCLSNELESRFIPAYLQ